MTSTNNTSTNEKFVTTNSTQEVVINDENINIKSKPKRKFWIIGILAFVVIAALIALTFFNVDSFKVRKLKKMFPDAKTIKIICSEPLTNLETDNTVEYVLFYKTNDKGEIYCSCPIDYANEINYGANIANPFYSLCAYVWTQGDEEINKKLFIEMKKSIEEGGLDYFNDMTNSANFLRKISGVEGIISTAEARKIMTNSISLLYGMDMANELSKKEDFRVLFEYKNAYPKVITYKTTEKKYNWNYPEEYLSSMDRETKSTFNALFGPAYISEERWRLSVVDEKTMNLDDFEQYCLSLENVKSKYDAYETGDAEDDKYTGEWKDGVRNGHGTMNYANGSKYEGEWINNKKQGQGTYYWADGDKYVGEFKNDKRDGQGTYYYDNGDKYEGEWKDGARNGQGTMNYANGDRYEGEWSNSKMNGQGTYYHANGNKYVGEFKNGKSSGQGTLYYKDGKTESGTWDGNIKK